MKKSTESDLVTSCLALLGYRGVLAWRSNNGGIWDPVRRRFRAFRGLRGVADILGVLPGGQLLAVECKLPEGRLTRDQRWFLDTVDSLGGAAVVVRDVRELAGFLDLALQRNGKGG